MTAARRRLESRRRTQTMSPEQLEEMRRQAREKVQEDLAAAPGALAQGVGNFARFLAEDPERTVKLGGLLTDAGGIAEFAGYYPDPFNEGKFLPSALQQAKEGDYLGAGLTTLGAIPVVGIFARGIKGARAVSDIADAAEDAEEALKAGHKLDFPDLEGSSVRLEPDPFGKENVLNINELQATELRKGYGTEMMNRIIADADRDGVTLTLMPERMGDDLLSMDDDELRAFYRKFGFRDRAPRTGDTPADSDSPLSKYMIREPKKAEEPKKASMSEAQYNAAIGAARGNPEEQQRLIAEKNEFYPKKPKKKKEPQKSARDLANEASIVEQDNTGVVRHIRSSDNEATENFGFEEPGLTRYSTAASRAFVKMKRPSQNISGDALIDRLELSSMTEDQSGIRSLVKEMGGLDDPNFIGKEGSGATITYDQFLERLNQYGPRRNVVRNANMQYPRVQELNYFDDVNDSDVASDFALTPVAGKGFGTDDYNDPLHRFNNLHTHDPNINPKTEAGRRALTGTSHRHYEDLGGEIEEALGPRHAIVAHSRGGLYRMGGAANPLDNGHLTISFDEFQVDGMTELSKLRSEITTQKRLKEKARVEKKATQFQNKASSIGDDALARFNSTEDDFTKNFNQIFRYYSTEGSSDGQKIGDMLMMDKFLNDVRTAEPAREFWEKNFHSMFRKPDFDPSNKEFLAKFVSSREGQDLMESMYPGDLVALRDKGNFGGFERFADRMKRYGEAPENGAGSLVIDSMSRILKTKSGPSRTSFAARAFEGGKLDELKEAGGEYGNAIAELDVLTGDKLSRTNVVDRAFVETTDKYGDVINRLTDLENQAREIRDTQTRGVRARLGRLNQKTRGFSSFSESMSSMDPSFAAKQKAQFRRINNLVRLLKQAEDGEGGIRSVKFDNGADFVQELVDGFRKGRDIVDITDTSADSFYSAQRALEQGRDHVLAVLLEGDFTSLRGLEQYKNRRLDLPEGGGNFDVRGSAEELEKQRQLLEDLQFEVRSLFGGGYEEFSKIFRADSKLDNISLNSGGASAVPETRTIAEQDKSLLSLIDEKAEFLKATAEADPDFSEDLVRQISKGYVNKVYDLPYESVSNSIEQVIQGDLANLFDGYLMNHTVPTRRVTAEELLEPDTDFGVPKFITIPTAGKTLQQRSESVSFEKPGGFKFQDGARDAAIKNFMEDNPGLVKIRGDLKETATAQNTKAAENGYKNKDVVLEITEDTRRKYAEAFARAINEDVQKYEKLALENNFGSVEEYIQSRGFDPVDSAEALRSNAMRYFKESNTDSETFVRYAKGGEVNLHKGIGAMAREVL